MNRLFACNMIALSLTGLIATNVVHAKGAARAVPVGASTTIVPSRTTMSICGRGAAPVPSMTVTSRIMNGAGGAGGPPRCADAVDAATASAKRGVSLMRESYDDERS